LLPLKRRPFFILFDGKIKIIYNMGMNTNWLPGGPYCEVSFITLNEYNTELAINHCLEKLKSLNYNIEFIDNNIKNRIERYCNKINDSIELNMFINICGKRRSKAYIERLSDEIIEIDFCFLEEDMNKNKMKKLKSLLNDLIALFNGIVGMIGWEMDCGLVFFETNETYPHKDYSIKKMKHYTNEDIYINNQKWLNGVDEIIWNDKIEI
jgi:vacuolar-type H+-ATPase subunit F/Vma7